ncbi:hypothetical protein GCM10010343_35020 [Streptomyces avidinii]|uniref:Uncharacterized protein n=1 Tax=Streptomyces avidinii TaxID=1895 RepID=A0ABS4LFS7_STRAV|nr:hypothetical protein [Streptomyces avidinii]GGZ06123.1 hypothetical protein GCM10010343_35020 [Streptomyces avidinii]
MSEVTALTGPVLGAVGGELHECLFQRCSTGDEFTQPEPVLEGELADSVRGRPGHRERVGAFGPHLRALGGQQRCQQTGVRGADGDVRRGSGAARGERGDALLRDQLAPADHREAVSGVLHLAHQMTGVEEALVLYKHQPGTLKGDWKYLHRRTGGNISSLAELIREAAADAVLTGTERIDRKVLANILINEHAQSTYENNWQEDPDPPTPGDSKNSDDEADQAVAS